MHLPYRWFPSTDAMQARVCAGTPPWVAKNAAAVHRAADGFTHVLTAHADSLILHSFSAKDEPLGSRCVDFSTARPDGQAAPVPMIPMPLYVREDMVYLGIGNWLIVLKSSLPAKGVELSRPIVALHGSARFSQARIVVALESGAVLFWDDEGRMSEFAAELSNPVCQFTASGWLAAASDDQCQIYRTGTNRIELKARMSNRSRPIAILCTAHPDQFALLVPAAQFMSTRCPDSQVNVLPVPHRF